MNSHGEFTQQTSSGISDIIHLHEIISGCFWQNKYTCGNRNIVVGKVNWLILISNSRHVLNAVLCFLGNLPASEFLIPTFRNFLSVPSS